MISPFRYLISCFNPSIYNIRRIYVGIPVKSGVFSELFQVWSIRANDIISLIMSMKIGYARKGHFSRSMAFNFSWWKQIVAKQHIFNIFVLDEMEVYLGICISKNWQNFLLKSSYSISHSSVKSKYYGETENSFFLLVQETIAETVILTTGFIPE